MHLKVLALPLVSLALLATATQPVKVLALKSTAFTAVQSLGSVPWSPIDLGFVRTDEGLLLDNGSSLTARRGAGKHLQLRQKAPMAVRISAESKAMGVSAGGPGCYALYVDLTFADGTHQWGLQAPFTPGTHDWERREIVYHPPKTIRQMSCWMLLRRPGKALFRGLAVATEPVIPDAHTFDANQVLGSQPYSGWLLRDVRERSDYQSHAGDGTSVLGIRMTAGRTHRQGATILTATLSAPDNTEDRILNLTYVRTLPPDSWRWLPCSRDRGQEQAHGTCSRLQHYNVGANGLCATLPLAAVAAGTSGIALGMDLHTPAYGRVFYHAARRELAVTWDIALTREVPSATVRLLQFSFRPDWGLRSAFARLYEIYPEAFKVRLRKQGIWMPFAPISQIANHQDFGFAIKEGTDETQWDDRHGIATFRYTEPMTWWMHLPPKPDRTPADLLEAVREQQKNPDIPQAGAFESSVMHDEFGRPAERSLDTPWCCGTVWSMNSMPGILGDRTDFKVKWNPQIRSRLYGPQATGGILDGEYVDSSEGYVTHVIDCNRAHFTAARTPLTFSTTNHTPGIFRGLIAYEYVKALADDLHPIGKLTMANSTPNSLWFLAPQLDIMGTETDWNPQGAWSPMKDEQLLYIRLLCHGKPFCLLQNTDFALFTGDKAERYMRRALFYGMFPGFFSADAASGHYFKTPELYNRDRHLFRKYVPVCKLVAEAGWQPETQAWSSHAAIWVERFGDHLFTVFNSHGQTETATLTFARPHARATALLGPAPRKITGKPAVRITLAPEEVAVIRLYGP